MATEVKPVPDGFHTATPYLIIKDAASAIDFYKKAFDAVELERITDDNGKVRHAEIKIGDSPFMMTDETKEYPDWQSPQSRGGSTVHIYLYVPDADAVFNQAIAAGAMELLPMKDQFYGDRSGGVTDPYGHVWYIASRIKNISAEDIAAHMAEMSGEK